MNIDIIDIGESTSSQTPEIISLDTPKKNEVIELNNGPKSFTSASFGPGAEMLMNGKKKDKHDINSGKDTIELEELSKLEDELNDLSKETNEVSKKNVMFADLGSMNINDDIKDTSIKLNTDNTPQRKETWDGFKTFNEIPVNPSETFREKASMSKEELLKKKFEMLKKLESLERKGVKLSKHYSMDSSLDEMTGEYESLVSEREKANSVNFQGKVMMACITGLEFLNNKFDPFDLKLDGWAESISENIDDYNEIFEELHEKYKSKTKIAPELKLLFQLTGGAIMLHMTNTMFKSSLPGMDDIMRQNPELMQQFTQAAVNSMSQQNSGFGSFMNDMNSSNTNYNNMQAQREEFIPPNPLASRPDIAMSRGPSKFDDAENMEQSFASVERTPAVPKTISRTNTSSSTRKDMTGPKDINDLLSGLKTKQIDVKQREMINDNESTISLDDMKELKKMKKPVRSKRPSSEKKKMNTVSLNI